MSARTTDRAIAVSAQGRAFLKAFEGLRRVAAQLPDGRWTVGHSHIETAREGAVVTPEDAELLLLYDLAGVEEAIAGAVQAPLAQNQFDALASLVFSAGEAALVEGDLAAKLNEGDVLGAAACFDAWRLADLNGREEAVDELIRRRAAEKALFLTPEDGARFAPRGILSARLDRSAASGGRAPVSLTQPEPTPAIAPPDDEDRPEERRAPPPYLADGALRRERPFGLTPLDAPFAPDMVHHNRPVVFIDPRLAWSDPAERVARAGDLDSPADPHGTAFAAGALALVIGAMGLAWGCSRLLTAPAADPAPAGAVVSGALGLLAVGAGLYLIYRRVGERRPA